MKENNEMTDQTNGVRPAFDDWVIVELMGHVRMTGWLTEVELFGSKLGKLSVIDKDGATVATQYFGGSSVYRITHCDEQTAKDLARSPDLDSNVSWSVREQIEREYKQRMKQIEARPDDDDKNEWDDMP
jgi:hypothetical protein